MGEPIKLCEAMDQGYAKQMCEHMEKYSQRNFGKGGVISIMRHDMVDIETSKSIGTQITIHYPSKRISAEYCPFCGGKLKGFK